MNICIEKKKIKTFFKVPLHVPKYKSHMNLGIYVDPITNAPSFPLLYDKSGLETS